MSNVSALQLGKSYNVLLLVIRSIKFLGTDFTHMARIMVLVFVLVKGFYLPHVVYQRLCIVLHCIWVKVSLLNLLKAYMCDRR